MKTLLANLKHAAWNRETISIAGGEFTPEEIYAAVKAIEKMIGALQHYQHGGENYRKVADDALKLIQ